MRLRMATAHQVDGDAGEKNKDDEGDRSTPNFTPVRDMAQPV